MAPPAEVHNPRRILAVALAESQGHLSRVIKASSGTGALAGTTQELALSTAYYRAQVPVWLDLVGATAPAEGQEEESATKQEAGKADPAIAREEGGDGITDSTTSGTDAADPTTPRQWADAFLADEAREVREALGGVVAVVEVGVGAEPGAAIRSSAAEEASASESSSTSQKQRDFVEHVGRLVQGLGMVYDLGEAGAEAGEEADEPEEVFREPWDGISVVVGVSPAPLDEDTMAAWDDACNAAGLEFVLVAPGQAETNEFGEKTGIPRLLEALEANDWELVLGGGGDGEDGDGDDALFGSFQEVKHPDDIDFDDPESVDFGFDREDFAGLRQAIWQQQTQDVMGDDEDKDKDDGDEDKDQAAAVEGMMRKLHVARLQAELLPPAQRRAMAARVVSEVMDEI